MDSSDAVVKILANRPMDVVRHLLHNPAAFKLDWLDLVGIDPETPMLDSEASAELATTRGDEEDRANARWYVLTKIEQRLLVQRLAENDVSEDTLRQPCSCDICRAWSDGAGGVSEVAGGACG